MIPDIKRDDFITGDKFRRLCDIDCQSAIDYRKKINSNPDTIITVFTETHELKNRIPILKKKPKQIILVSHNSDGNIQWKKGREEYDYEWRKETNILYWFSQNVLTTDPTLIPIPIGLENDYIFSPDIKQQYMVDLRKRRIKKNVQMFICYNPETNRPERYPPLTLFKDCPWVIITEGFNNINLYKRFFDIMVQSLFVLCPAGNGTDTHRLWEALYLGCIPIVKRYPFTEYYEKYLPILIVDKWEEITLSFLIEKFIQIDRKNYDYEILKMSYWKNKILTLKKDLCNGISA